MKNLSQLINNSLGSHEIKFGIKKLIHSVSIQIKFDGEFPDMANKEIHLFKIEKNHQTHINGVAYNENDLYKTAIGKNDQRTHDISLQALHIKLREYFFNYILMVNELDKENEPSDTNYENFEFYLDIVTESNFNGTIKDLYLTFWREIIGNIANSIHSEPGLISALKDNARQIIYDSFHALHKKLYDQKYGTK